MTYWVGPGGTQVPQLDGGPSAVKHSSQGHCQGVGGGRQAEAPPPVLAVIWSGLICVIWTVSAVQGSPGGPVDMVGASLHAAMGDEGTARRRCTFSPSVGSHCCQEGPELSH